MIPDPYPPAVGWWREPLVHFLLLGAALFLLFHWRGGGAAGSNRIVITPGQIQSLSTQFARTWQRPPTEAELKGLVDDYVREEIATREAMVIGLDRDDAIIRRRLRQKLEFVAEDTVDATPASVAELQSWLDAHKEQYAVEPEVSFRHVYLSPDRRGATLDADAKRLLSSLAAAGPDANVEALGDAIMLPRDFERVTRSDIARQFGQEFADEVVALEPGRWAGPVSSGYGLHLVFIRERQAGGALPLSSVRPQVERDLLSDRRRKQLTEMYERLLANYRVTIEKPAVPTTPAPAAGAATP